MLKKVLALLTALTLILGSGPGVSAAEAPETAVHFALEQEGNVYWLEVSVKNATFNVIQFALNFDPKEFVLIDASGKKTEDVEKYQENLSSGWLSEIGCEADNETGYLTFAGFVMPGQKAKAPVNEGGTATADEKGLSLFRFRFKKLSAVKKGFSLATDQTGLTYNEALPEGGTLVDGKNALEATLRFTYPAGTAKDTEETLKPVDAGAKPMTRTERLKNTLVFQEGNTFAVVEGKRRTIYQDEPDALPYEESGVLYLPLRFAAEQLGATVSWDAKNRSATVEKDGVTATIPIGYSDFTLNGEQKTASGKAVIKDSRTMVSVDVLEAVLNLEHTNFSGLEILAPADAPWNPYGDTEMDLAQDISLLLSPLVGAIAG